ncbi:MAG: hypothetical protein ABI114_16480 [Rhodanobacter sp.]
MTAIESGTAAVFGNATAGHGLATNTAFATGRRFAFGPEGSTASALAICSAGAVVGVAGGVRQLAVSVQYLDRDTALSVCVDE